MLPCPCAVSPVWWSYSKAICLFDLGDWKPKLANLHYIPKIMLCNHWSVYIRICMCGKYGSDEFDPSNSFFLAHPIYFLSCACKKWDDRRRHVFFCWSNLKVRSITIFCFVKPDILYIMDINLRVYLTKCDLKYKYKVLSRSLS